MFDWDPIHNVSEIRKHFPVLDNSVYLISNSLGAVPRSAKEGLERFYSLWAEKGVTAWSDEWWDLPVEVGRELAGFLTAEDGSVTLMAHATQAHWVALSTCFKHRDKQRNRVIMTDHDFPSTLYAVAGIAEFMEWDVVVLKSGGRSSVDTEEILAELDERTLFLATSHVNFKSASIQDIEALAARAGEVGALTLIDGYHGPGAIPVDLTALGVDFYVGGCLKWLCGGPGNAFLYVRPDTAERLSPHLTGWWGHRRPFIFSTEMEFAPDDRKFMSGTVPVPSLYTARSGLSILRRIGMDRIRPKSLLLTGRIIEESLTRGFTVHTPLEADRRGGAVSIALPHAFQVKQALERDRIKVDFRKGNREEPDVIRVGPHFYSLDDEISVLFSAIDRIFSSEEYKKFPAEIDHVT